MNYKEREEHQKRSERAGNIVVVIFGLITLTLLISFFGVSLYNHILAFEEVRILFFAVIIILIIITLFAGVRRFVYKK